MLVNRFGFSEQEAGDYISLPYTIVAVVGPFLGIFLDKVGHRVTMTNFSCILLIIT